MFDFIRQISNVSMILFFQSVILSLLLIVMVFTSIFWSFWIPIIDYVSGNFTNKQIRVTGVARGSCHVRFDQRRQGLVDVKSFYKKCFFCSYTHTITSKTARSGMVHSGPNIVFPPIFYVIPIPRPT